MLLAAIGIQSSEARRSKRDVTLLYWNIQNGMWDGQTDDYQRFTSWVKAQNPDICVWCEAQKLYVTSTAKSEVETEAECMARWKRLAERYGHTYIYAQDSDRGYRRLHMRFIRPSH